MYIEGLDPTAVSDEADFKLGQRGMDGTGRTFVYLQASDDVDTGMVVLIVADGTAEGITTTNAAVGTAACNQCAVAMADVLEDQYFWGCIYATGINAVDVLVADGAVKYTQLYTTDTAGVLDDAIGTILEIHGLVITTTEIVGSGPNLLPAVVNWPRVDVALT